MGWNGPLWCKSAVRDIVPVVAAGFEDAGRGFPSLSAPGFIMQVQVQGSTPRGPYSCARTCATPRLHLPCTGFVQCTHEAFLHIFPSSCDVCDTKDAATFELGALKHVSARMANINIFHFFTFVHCVWSE